LIDIVCYQSGVGDEKIKSTTDFFQIWAFNNQWGEGNSINYVDNNIITKDYTIPYCVWDFFFTGLFTKTTESQNVYLFDNYTLSDWAITVANTTNRREITDLWYTNNLPFAVSYSITVPYSVDQTRTYFRFVSNIWWVETVHGVGNSGTIQVSWVIPPNLTAKFYFYCTRNTCTATFTWTNANYTTIKTTSIQKEINIIWKATSILPVSSEMSMVTEWDVNGEWFQQPTKITTFTQEPQKKQWQIYYNTSTWKLMFCNWTKRWEVTVTYPS
jgi:hypothetical protein